MSYSSKYDHSAPPWQVCGNGPFDHRLWLFPIKPANIYLAASMAEQAAASRFALQLIDAGFKVTSTWLRQDFSDRPEPSRQWYKYAAYEAKWGAQDLADLGRADTLVILANEPSSSGGYWVELGYFLGAARENVLFVGDRRNVFAYADVVRWAPSTEGLIIWLQDERHGGILGLRYQSPPPDPVGLGLVQAQVLAEEYRPKPLESEDCPF